jgi:hypothetical protein
MSSKSDRHRGQMSKSNSAYSTAGPKGNRGPEEHMVADSKRGRPQDEPARSVIHASNNSGKVSQVHRGIKDERSGTPAWFASPHGTHSPDGAVKRPMRATRDAVKR